MPEIRDITDPTEFIPEPSTPWWIWALVALGVLLLLLALWLIIRHKKSTSSRHTLLDEARAKLSELRSQSAKLSPEHIATKTSIIIRNYLETAFNDPAIFETNEEFTLRTNALKALHPDTKMQITHHLQQLSELKYEPHTDSASANQRACSLIDEADKLLAHIELHP